MKVGLIGYGRMGAEVESVLGGNFAGEAIECIRIDPSSPSADFRDVESAIEKLGTSGRLDVCIEFTTPQTVIANIESTLRSGIPLVVGTTGWQDQEDRVRSLVETYNGSLVFSTNFSLGVALFLKSLEYASKLFSSFEQYDVGGYEIHHNRKVDSPSGTAHSIVDVLLRQVSSKKRVSYDRQDVRRADDTLHFASLRVGDVPGTHVVRFDSDCDTVQFIHEARSRRGFATGAALAASWVRSVSGMWEFRDLLSLQIKDEVTGE